MKPEYKKPLAYFIALAVLLSIIFFVFPINIFDGQIVIENGLQKVTVDHQLSLSNFVGIGYDKAELEEKGIVDFYLTTKGWIMAFIFTLGFPALFAYRIFLRSTKS